MIQSKMMPRNRSWGSADVIDKKLTMIEHLEELRKRIIIISLSILIASILCFVYIEEITDVLIKPAEGLEFLYLAPSELFLTYIRIAFSVGIVISAPVILYQVWVFVRPGLKKTERLYLSLTLVMAVIFFTLGVLFSYFVIIPFTLQFFTKISRDNITPLFSIQSYISFCSSFFFTFGLTFQMPLVILLLTRLNLITPQLLKKARKYLILAIFTLAAVLTPPDVVSQILMALPLWLLLELSISLSSLIYRKKDLELED